MPKTAIEYKIDAWNPSQAINAGALYLSKAANELFNGDWMWAAAAYNMGRTGALRVKNKTINPQTQKPYTMPTETTNYVAKIGKISGMW